MGEVLFGVALVVVGAALAYGIILLDRFFRKVGGNPNPVSTQPFGMLTKELLSFAILIAAVGMVMLGLIALNKIGVLPLQMR